VVMLKMSLWKKAVEERPDLKPFNPPNNYAAQESETLTGMMGVDTTLEGSEAVVAQKENCNFAGCRLNADV